MSKPINPIESFFIRYHIVILVVIGCVALGASIASTYMAYADATTPNQETATTSGIPTVFDNKTVERIKQLYTSDTENIQTPPPSGRINPFSE